MMIAKQYDEFSMDGIHAMNPITYRDTGLPVKYIVTDIDPPTVHPRWIASGVYQNVVVAPTLDTVVTVVNDARLDVLVTLGEYLPGIDIAKFTA